MRKFTAAVALAAALAAGSAVTLTAASAGEGHDKVTICHAAGRDGTTKYVILTLAREAVYGQAGHFYENGTPRAGHEDDYLGPCKPDDTTTTTAPEEESTTTTSTTAPPILVPPVMIVPPAPPAVPTPHPNPPYGG